MKTQTTGIAEQVTSFPTVKYVFAALLAVLLVIAVGHLYVFSGLTTLYLGLPLWVWLQLGVVSLMLGIAWIAVQLIARATSGGM